MTFVEIPRRFGHGRARIVGIDTAVEAFENQIIITNKENLTCFFEVPCNVILDQTLQIRQAVLRTNHRKQLIALRLPIKFYWHIIALVTQP